MVPLEHFVEGPCCCTKCRHIYSRRVYASAFDTEHRASTTLHSRNHCNILHIHFLPCSVSSTKEYCTYFSHDTKSISTHSSDPQLSIMLFWNVGEIMCSSSLAPLYHIVVLHHNNHRWQILPTGIVYDQTVLVRRQCYLAP